MMPAIGMDERISEILSALLCYREPDSEDVRCAIDGILKLIEEDRAKRECCEDVKRGCVRLADQFTRYGEAGRRIAADIRSRSIEFLREKGEKAM